VDVPAPATNGQTRGDGCPADWELFLLRLRYREGQLIAVAGNRPVLLDDPGTAWVVFSGHVEVYAVRTEGGQATGARRHLFRADTGVALLGIDLQSQRVGLLASGAPGTQLLRVERASLARLAAAPEFAPLVAGPGGWAQLDHFHGLVLAGLAATAEERQRAERERHATREQADRGQREAAFGRLAHVAAPRASGRWDVMEGSDPLFAACRLV